MENINRGLYQDQHKKTFTIKSKKEKSELNLQISKVSGKKVETIDENNIWSATCMVR